MGTLRWTLALARWHAFAWSDRLRRNPYFAVTFGGILFALLANGALLWYGTLAFYELLRTRGQNPEAYAWLPLAFGLLLAFGGGRAQFSPGLSRFWILEASPVPPFHKHLDRALSTLASSALLGGAPIFAALAYAGHPGWHALAHLLGASALGALLRPYALPDYLASAAVGYLLGWVDAFLIRVVSEEGLLAFGLPGVGEERLWLLVQPLLPLRFFLPEPPPVLALAAAVAFFALLLATAGPERKPGLSRLAAWAWRTAGRLPGARLGYAVEELFTELNMSFGRVAAFLGFLLGLHRYLGFALPLYPSVWTAAFFLWWPVLIRRRPLAGVLAANLGVRRDAEATLLRGKLEALFLTLLPFALWLIPAPGFLALGLWLLLGWLLARWLVLLPAGLVAFLLWLGGGVALWAVRG
jgi:hypothetical protein